MEAAQGVEQDFSRRSGIAAKAKQSLVLFKFLLQLGSASKPPRGITEGGTPPPSTPP